MDETKQDIVVALRKEAESSRGMEGDYYGEQYATDDSLLDEAANEIEQLRADRQWIQVSDRFPEIGVDVLVCVPDCDPGSTSQTTGFYDDSGWYVRFWLPNAVPTHWMPLPKPPENEQ